MSHKRYVEESEWERGSQKRAHISKEDNADEVVLHVLPPQIHIQQGDPHQHLLVALPSELILLDITSSENQIHEQMLKLIDACAMNLESIELALFNSRCETTRWKFWRDAVSILQQQSTRLVEFRTRSCVKKVKGSGAYDLLAGMFALAECTNLQILDLTTPFPLIHVLACASRLSNIWDIRLPLDGFALETSDFRMICKELGQHPSLCHGCGDESFPLVLPNNRKHMEIMRKYWPGELQRILAQRYDGATGIPSEWLPLLVDRELQFVTFVDVDILSDPEENELEQYDFENIVSRYLMRCSNLTQLGISETDETCTRMFELLTPLLPQLVKLEIHEKIIIDLDLLSNIQPSKLQALKLDNCDCDDKSVRQPDRRWTGVWDNIDQLRVYLPGLIDYKYELFDIRTIRCELVSSEIVEDEQP